ncbi:hypothetical protein [Breoghania sp. JC706]|uniref:hypothetical protein n=1 Tax=Breoghania sp. JC706 TaxID=3117732 RepID=UPI0030085E58
MKEAVTFSSVIVAGLGAIAFFLLGGVRSDVSEIRNELKNLHAIDSSNKNDLKNSEKDLRFTISDLNTQLQLNTKAIEGLEQSLNGVQVSISQLATQYSEIDKNQARLFDKLVSMDSSQTLFNNAILTRILTIGNTGEESAPPEWRKNNRDMLDLMRGKDDPMRELGNSMLEQQ